MYRLDATPFSNGFEFDLIANQERIVIGIRSVAEPKEMMLIRKGFEFINGVLDRTVDRVWVPVNSTVSRYHRERLCSVAKQRRKEDIRIHISRYDADMAGLEECPKCKVDTSIS